MANSGEQGALDRQSLLSKLLDAVKQCQIRFGGRTELATENDSRVVCLCTQFENVLQHGIRRNSKGFLRIRHVTEVMKGLNLLNGETDAVFWQLLRTVLNKHEYERYMLLKNINSDIGKGRAWLRSALNERSLERYIHMMLADANQISQFYEDWAFLMDQERSSMLPMMAAGLGSILFAINIDNPDLNTYRFSNSIPPPPPAEVNQNHSKNKTYEPEPVLAKSLGGGAGKRKKKKKHPVPQVVSFDDNEISQCQLRSQDLLPSSYSAPSTCLSSPVTSAAQISVFTFTQSQSEIQSSDMNSDGKLTNIPAVSVTTTKSSIPLSSSAPSMSLGSAKDITDPENVTTSTVNSLESIPPNVVHSDSNKATYPICAVNVQVDRQRSGVSSSSLSLTPDSTDQCHPLHTTLTPIDDTSVGELIPVCQNEDIPSSAEDSISIPSFCEDVENAVAALAIAQRIPSWSMSSNSSHGSKRGSQSKSRSETLTMNAEELREAVLAVLQKKEDIEDKNKALRSLLDREMEMSAGLRAEMNENEKHHAEKIEKLESKIQTLSRENELLKHQLRKYITAVQMLKHDSSRINELTAVVGEIQPPIPEPKVYIDHQFEANEYEKKLVQVAEMHGELMEFNDRLHRLLLQKEITIRRLREELIDLRGPLPEDNQTSDDEVSITSDYDASSQTTPLRPLINVWIPSAFLTGRATDSHHVYQVYIRIRDDEWNVYRRYAQFYALHKILKKKDPIINTFDFPPKKTIGKKDAKVVEQRRRRLQHYLRCVLNWLLQNNSELANSPEKETFIALMPFFGDQTTDKKKYGSSTTSGRARITNLSSSPGSQAQQPAQHYTGL